MRTVVIILILALFALAGLYVYGLTLSPETRTIEQDAVGSVDA